MADKIVVMHDGIVEQIGAPLELYDRPANLFVAGFIGSPGDELPRRAASSGGGFDGRRAARCCRCRARRPRRQAAGDLRHPARALPPRPTSGMPVEVIVVEPTGSETQVMAAAGGTRCHLRVPRARHRRARARSSASCRTAARAPVRQRRQARRASAQLIIRQHTTQHPGDARNDASSTRAQTPLNSASTARRCPPPVPVGRRSLRAEPRRRRHAPAPAPSLHAREGRHAARAALDALREGRRGRLARQHQEVHRSDRRRGARRQEGWEDIRPKAAVAANVGSGPDIMIGCGSTTPHPYPDKLLDVTDIAEYLGKKYGGWYAGRRELRQDARHSKFIALPLGAPSATRSSIAKHGEGRPASPSSRRRPTGSSNCARR